MGVLTAGASQLGIIAGQTKTLAGALDTTLDLSTSWTRTLVNIPMVALLGRVFGEGSAF